jgi:hypothetical protein
VGVGEGFGFCADTDTPAAATMHIADKYLNKNDFKSADMLLGL